MRNCSLLLADIVFRSRTFSVGTVLKIPNRYVSLVAIVFLFRVDRMVTSLSSYSALPALFLFLFYYCLLFPSSFRASHFPFSICNLGPLFPSTLHRLHAHVSSHPPFTDISSPSFPLQFYEGIRIMVAAPSDFSNMERANNRSKYLDLVEESDGSEFVESDDESKTGTPLPSTDKNIRQRVKSITGEEEKEITELEIAEKELLSVGVDPNQFRNTSVVQQEILREEEDLKRKKSLLITRSGSKKGNGDGGGQHSPESHADSPDSDAQHQLTDPAADGDNPPTSGFSSLAFLKMASRKQPSQGPSQQDDAPAPSNGALSSAGFHNSTGFPVQSTSGNTSGSASGSNNAFLSAPVVTSSASWSDTHAGSNSNTAPLRSALKTPIATGQKTLKRPQSVHFAP